MSVLIPRALVTLVVVTVAVAGSSPPATAAAPINHDDPFGLGWPAFAPSVLADGPASTEAGCTPGSVGCVDQVVAEMQRRTNLLGCGHDAVFAYVYQRTTQQYRLAVDDPDFFADNAFVNHEDALFADTYFQAHDGYHAGSLAEVPPAWRIAFYAAEQGEVTSLGDMLLGMNAHINRDLPFVLNAIGLVDGDGASRKADHDRVNDILDLVNQYVLFEVALAYDPTVGDGHAPNTTMDAHSLQNLVTRWREQAWRDAERLAEARTPEARLKAAATIENQAAARARELRNSYSYHPNDDPGARDAYCAGHLAG